MSTETEALARVASERDLIRRIDANILALLDAGHDFSPAGLIIDNRTGLSDDALVGRRDGPPETHELTDVVVGDIVVADPEVNLDDLFDEEAVDLAKIYQEAIAGDIEELARVTSTPKWLITGEVDEVELCAMAPYSEAEPRG